MCDICVYAASTMDDELRLLVRNRSFNQALTMTNHTSLRPKTSLQSPQHHRHANHSSTVFVRRLPLLKCQSISGIILLAAVSFVYISIISRIPTTTILFPLLSSQTENPSIFVTATARVATATSYLSPPQHLHSWFPSNHYHSLIKHDSNILRRHHQQQYLLLQTLRGGGRNDEDMEGEEEEDEDDDDQLLDFDDDDDEMNSISGGNSNEFDEVTMLDRVVLSYQKTPPFTKLYLTISMVITMYGYLCNRNEFPNVLLLQWKKVITQFQFWRIVTSFFHFGPFGLGYVMTLQFVWVYMSTLERIHHNKPYDFWIMILFGQLSMVIGYPIMKLSPKFLGHNLSTFLVYIWSRYHEGVEVNMFELFNTRAELLPWFFLGQTFLLEGEIPILDFLGIVFGHIYHHCKTVGILRAPPSIVQWYETSDAAQRIRDLYKPISSEFDAQ